MRYGPYSIAGSLPYRGTPAAGIPFSAGTLGLALALTVGAVVSLLPAEEFADPTEPVVWGTAALLFGFSVCHRWLARQRGQNAWVSAVPMTAYYYFYRYGLGVLVIYYWDLFAWEAFPAMKQRFMLLGARQNLGNACQLVLLGGLGLLAGALLPSQKLALKLPRIRWAADESRFRRNVALYAPVAFLISAIGGKLPLSLMYAISSFGIVQYTLIVLASYWLFSARTAAVRLFWTALLGALCVFALVVGSLSGQLGPVLLPFTTPLVGYALAKRTLPWKTLLTVVPAAFFLVFPFLTAYKLAKHELVDPTPHTRVEVAKERLKTLDYRAGVELSMDRFLARMALSEFPAIYARYYPELYSFLFGRTLALELSGVIPRLVWADKPEMSVELNRYSAGVGIIRAGGETSAVFDAVSEYYVNFGPPGVFLLCVLHAFYLNLLYSWLHVNLGEVIAAAIWAGLFTQNLDLFGVGQLFTTHIKLVPVWVAILYLLSRKRGASVFKAV